MGHRYYEPLSDFVSPVSTDRTNGTYMHYLFKRIAPLKENEANWFTSFYRITCARIMFQTDGRLDRQIDHEQHNSSLLTDNATNNEKIIYE